MKTPISMRIEADLLEAAKGAAAAEHRSLANLVEVALADRIGYRLSDRRMEVHLPEGASALRGAKVVPAEWETPTEVERAQASIDRLAELATAAERRPGRRTTRQPQRIKSGG